MNIPCSGDHLMGLAAPEAAARCPKQPSGREGKQPAPMPATEAAGCAQLEMWLCRG